MYKMPPQRSGSYARNNLPLGMSQGFKTPAVLRLNGDNVTTAQKLQRAFQKGAFMYQYVAGPDRSLHTCRDQNDLNRLKDTLRGGVIIRHLKPDPLPQASPIYADYYSPPRPSRYSVGCFW